MIVRTDRGELNARKLQICLMGSWSVLVLKTERAYSLPATLDSLD